MRGCVRVPGKVEVILPSTIVDRTIEHAALTAVLLISSHTWLDFCVRYVSNNHTMSCYLTCESILYVDSQTKASE